MKHSHSFLKYYKKHFLFLFAEGTYHGVYLYVESSAPALSNDNAKLRSPWLNPVSGGQYLKFFYYMYGSTMGELMVHIELEGKTSYILFYEKGDKGMGWKGATKDIDTDVRYRVCTILYKGTSSIFLILPACSDHVKDLRHRTECSQSSLETPKENPINVRRPPSSSHIFLLL